MENMGTFLVERKDEMIINRQNCSIIRTLIMFQLIVTNFFIIAGNVKNLFFDTTPVTVEQVNTKS